MDAIFAGVDAAHAGLGLNVPLGTYVRLGALAAGGLARADGESVRSARVDLVARFVFDPLRQHRWGPYGGGGASVRYERPGPLHPRLLLVLGVEGRPLHGIMPALETGFGGGTRVGLVLRRVVAERR